MPKSKSKYRRSDTYVIKSAEARPSRIKSKRDGKAAAPTRADRRIARAILKSRKA
jgi:hypothetical protein